MKRLKRLKRIAEEKTYKFKSPITITLSDETGEIDNANLAEYKEYSNELSEAVQEEMNEFGPTGLAEYVDEPLKSKIESIMVTVKNYAAETIVKVNKELNDKEMTELKYYIEGQFSDGWGEGFEQQPIDSYEETEIDEDQYYQDQDAGMDVDRSDYEYQTTIEVRAHFWNNKDWYITLE